MVADSFKISDGVKQTGDRMGLAVRKLASRQSDKIGAELVLIFIGQLFESPYVLDLFLVVNLNNLKASVMAVSGILGHFVGQPVTFETAKGRILEKALVEKHRVGVFVAAFDRLFAKLYHGILKGKKATVFTRLKTV